jgi:N-acetylglucosaminyldiphosphoundecaprenol N-acetyl-beta-D-mannosaminyltransferase
VDPGERMTAVIDYPVRRLFGVPIHAVTREQALDACANAIETKKHLLVGIVNTAKVVKMQDQVILRDSVLASDLVLADGMGVVWASRVLRRSLPARVTGIDLFLDLVGLAAEKSYGVYFLGATDEVLEACIARLRADHPTLRIAGSRNGYFDDAESDAVAADIRAADADVLFVGMTSPLKEIFLSRHGAGLGVSVCHGVGGSFDVVAGKVKRAPVFWQKCGLEWLYRTLQEPRRLWKRYLVTNSLFAWMVVKELFRGTKDRPAADTESANASCERSTD